VSRRGRHFTLENARLYSRPDTPPPLLLAVAGPDEREVFARLGTRASAA